MENPDCSLKNTLAVLPQITLYEQGSLNCTKRPLKAEIC